MRDASPLRYSGGKWRLFGLFKRTIAINFQTPPKYVEPYAGGASLALSLLFKNIVREVWINDLDPAIHAFWHSVLKHPEEFSKHIKTAPLTPAEWKKQKKIYASGLASGRFALGFATFYLNRTNHSGILNGGMIGGKNQAGPWTLSARFNRDELARRVLQVGEWKSKIHLSRKDAAVFLSSVALEQNLCIFKESLAVRGSLRNRLCEYVVFEFHVIDFRCEATSLSIDFFRHRIAMNRKLAFQRLQIHLDDFVHQLLCVAYLLKNLGDRVKSGHT